MIEDYLDKASDQDWKLALDEELRNTPELIDWLFADSMVSSTNTDRFARWVVAGRIIKEDDFSAQDLFWLVLCEEPEISRKAILLLREKYMKHQIDSVTERVARMNGWEH